MTAIQKLRTQMSWHKQVLRSRTVPDTARCVLRCLFLALLTYCLTQPAPLLAHSATLAQDQPTIAQEFRYHMPDAEEVFLVWGIDGWQVVPEENRVAGTVVKDGAMHTPMVREGDTFVAQVQVPAGATIDYGFLITKERTDTAVHVWEAADDPVVATRDGFVEVQTTLALADGQVTVNFAHASLVSQEIRYHLPEAEEVFLVWGINGWVLAPQENRPAGTVLKDDTMHTPMVREGDTFMAKVQVPDGATIDYAFLITNTRIGTAIEIRDANGDRGYQTVAMEGGVTDIAIVTQQIRYYMPEAGEAFLVWGINGWAPVSEGIRPSRTVLKNGLMHTPMIREGDIFVSKVQSPADASIDYGFLITKTRSGAAVEVWDNNGDQDYHTVATPGGVTGVRATVTLGEAKTWTNVPGLYLLIGAIAIAGIGATLHAARLHSRRAVALAAISLTLLGLVLRLWVAWDTNRHFPEPSAHASGKELGTDELPDSLTQDSLLQWPGRMPVYPLFLAACDRVFGGSDRAVRYVQAFVGATVIPLTWMLARRFTGGKAALMAGALIALHPAVILRVTRLDVENLYTPLLLLALVSLLWALEEPLPHRLGVAGAPLALANLCHPTAVVFPALLPLFLPRIWSRKRKAILCAAFAGATAAFVALWTYHNYRTYQTLLPPRISAASLWQGSPEFFHFMESRVPISQIWYEQLNAARNGGFDPFTVEGGRYFTARALDSIVAEPGAYVIYSILKMAFFWIGHPAIDWPEYAVFSVVAMRPYLSTLGIVGLFTATLLPLVALAVLTVRSVVDGHLQHLAPLLIVCGYFTVLHAITYPEVRFSEPLHPILLTMIVAAVQPREYPWRIAVRA